jgi:hypothetical protein
MVDVKDASRKRPIDHLWDPVSTELEAMDDVLTAQRAAVSVRAV